MKKIMAFLLAALTLISVFAVTALAAEEATPSVMTELEQLYIDGKQFKASDYPKNTSRQDLQILAVAESGFKSQTSSSGYGLYIYVYNPGCYAFEDSDNNTVQMGLNLSSASYVYYGLKIMSKSSDNRFIKFKVQSYGQNAASELYKLQQNASERAYNIAALRLKKNSQITAFAVGKVYLFSGYDFNKTLTCSVRDHEVIEVELHATSWVSPNAGSTVEGGQADKYHHYEIHSVYFAIDKSYLQRYGFISAIRANYTQAKLTPIVVTRPGVFDALTKDMIQNATPVTKDTDVMDLVANYRYVWDTDTDTGHIEGDWGYSETNLAPWLDAPFQGDRYDRLAYLFENDQLPEDFDMGEASYMLGFTSEELEAYYDNQIDRGIDKNALYSDIQLKQNIDYSYKDMFDLRTYESNLSGFAKWWHDWFVDDDSYLKENFLTEISKIQVIENPKEYATISEDLKEHYSKNLCINVCDLENFSKFCKDEVTSDQVVVILRYGLADYRCTLIEDVWEAANGSETVGWSIEKSAFMDVSVAQITFTSKGVDTVIPVVSNTVDSFGDGLVFDVVGDLEVDLGDVGDGITNWITDLFNQLGEKLKIIVGIIALLVIIAVVLLVVVPAVKALFAANSNKRLRNIEKALKSKRSKK
ncbi:MAG: hypothetical protein E7650_06675 [Ruminococcaceae bacterium]|nr:hypothetical protein [Oscillospiraceae bacterium]